MAQAKRDQNYVPTLLAVSNADGVTPVVLYADPTTHRLLVSVSVALSSLSDVTITSAAQGDILYYNGTAWVNLPAGTSGFFLKTQGAGANPLWATVAGGSGTVTSVSVTTANGVSGSVATATTTPAITLTLGAITPTSVAINGGTALTTSNQTGTGNIVLATSPTLVTPVLGVAAATTINKVTITAPATSSTLTVADGKTLTASNSITIAGTDGKTLTVSNSLTLAGTDATTITFQGTDTYVGRTTTDTLTNKRVTPRVNTITSSATPSPNGDTTDVFTVTALATGATFAAPSGSPQDGQRLILRIKDNSTSQTLAFNAIYRVVGTTLPSSTVIGKTVYIGLIYNTAELKWDVVAIASQA